MSFPQGPSYAPAAPARRRPESPGAAVFTDPDLQAVIEQALQQNRDLRVAVANIQAANAQVATQRSALFPAVNASASELYQQTPNVLTARGGTAQQRFYSASIGFSSWELDLFGRTRSLTRAAYDQYLASEDNRRAVQISLIAQVATQWFTYAADRDLLAVAQQTLAAQQESLNLTQRPLQRQARPRISTCARPRPRWPQARSDVANFTTNAAQARNALDLLVGAPVA